MQWLHERNSILGYTCICCLVGYLFLKIRVQGADTTSVFVVRFEWWLQWIPLIYLSSINVVVTTKMRCVFYEVGSEHSCNSEENGSSESYMFVSGDLIRSFICASTVSDREQCSGHLSMNCVCVCAATAYRQSCRPFLCSTYKEQLEKRMWAVWQILVLFSIETAMNSQHTFVSLDWASECMTIRSDGSPMHTDCKMI